MEKKRFVVIRIGDPKTERAVKVFAKTPRGLSNGFWVNPADAVFRATGHHHGRRGCIQEFVYGLAAAGNEVTVLDFRARIEKGFQKIDGSRPDLRHAFDPHFVFGLLWGLEKWPATH